MDGVEREHTSKRLPGRQIQFNGLPVYPVIRAFIRIQVIQFYISVLIMHNLLRFIRRQGLSLSRGRIRGIK